MSENIKETRFFVASHCFIRSIIGATNGKFLITRRSADNDYMPNKWDIPGGGAEAGETAVHALYREVREETDLTVKNGKIDFVYTNLESRPGTQYYVLIFECEYKYDRETINIRLDDEHSDFMFVDYDEALEMDLIPFLREYILYKKKISELASGSKLIVERKTNKTTDELERKFLVKPEYINNVRSISTSHMYIKQTYLSFDPELRIRKILFQDGSRKHTQTAKSNKKVGRKEKEFEIGINTYNDLYKNRESGDLFKTRYLIPINHGILIAEMDIYDDFDDIVTVEVEFKNEYSMNSFNPPEWFGKEVTGDDKYSNKSMAKDLKNK